MTDLTTEPDIISKYFAEYVRKGFNKIFEEQRRIAASSIYSKQAYFIDGRPRSRSGRLQKALENPTYFLSGTGSSLSASIEYPSYLRFLDMKRLGNHRIYNRPIWGILYKQTFNEIRYEFRSWLKNLVYNALSNSYQQ